MNIRRSLASLGLAATLALTGGTAAQVVTADNNKAEAYTKNSCYYTYVNNNSYNQKVLSCYYDYNWWEEVFLGKRDGRYYTYVAINT